MNGVSKIEKNIKLDAEIRSQIEGLRDLIYEQSYKGSIFISVNLTISLFQVVKSEQSFLFSFDFLELYFIYMNLKELLLVAKIHFYFITTFDNILLLF